MIEKPFHYSSIQFAAPVWNMLSVPGRPWLVVEQRDDVNRKVILTAIDYVQKKVVWSKDVLPERWWVNLVAVTPNQILLKVFDNTSNPDLTHWQALAVDDGSPLEEVEEDKTLHTNEMIQPFQYLAGEHDFETVNKFLKNRLQIIPILGADYLEQAGFVFISFYFGAPGSFVNQIVCFTNKGDLLWQEEIGTNLKGIGVNTFFVVSEYLFFVKNRTELVTFRIV